jgi:hypothetical protein
MVLRGRSKDASICNWCQYEQIAKVCYVLITCYYAYVLKARRTMSRPPSTSKRISDLKKELVTCQNPYELLAEALESNERLLKQLNRYEAMNNKH